MMGGLTRESWPGTKEVLCKTHSQAIYAAKCATINSLEVKIWERIKDCSKIYSGNNSCSWGLHCKQRHEDAELLSLQKSLQCTLIMCFWVIKKTWKRCFQNLYLGRRENEHIK